MDLSRYLCRSKFLTMNEASKRVRRKVPWGMAILFVSTLLCAIACMLWIRALSRRDELIGNFLNHFVRLTSYDTGLSFQWDPIAAQQPEHWTLTSRPALFMPGHFKWFFECYIERQPTCISYGCFSYSRANSNYMESGLLMHGKIYLFEVPQWFFIICFGFLPTRAMLRRAKRRRRERNALCVICGYDLRATPDRCPECGQMTEKRLTV